MNEQPIKYQHELISTLKEMQMDYEEIFERKLGIVSFNIHGDSKLYFLFEMSKNPDENKLINVRLAYATGHIDDTTGIHIIADSVAMRSNYLFVLNEGKDVAMIDLIRGE